MFSMLIYTEDKEVPDIALTAQTMSELLQIYVTYITKANIVDHSTETTYLYEDTKELN